MSEKHDPALWKLLTDKNPKSSDLDNEVIDCDEDNEVTVMIMPKINKEGHLLV